MAMNPFEGIDLATLQTLKADCVSCLRAILTNQSYSLNGRSLTRANLGEVKAMLGQIQSAIDLTSGTATDVTFAHFNTAGTGTSGTNW